MKVTDRRTRRDFAELLTDLVDGDVPNQKIILVMDNLTTHKLSVLYDRYAPAAAARIAVLFALKSGDRIKP